MVLFLVDLFRPRRYHSFIAAARHKTCALTGQEMKITNLQTEVVEFPYNPPMGLSANNYLRTGSCVLVFLESDQGAVGEGLVYAFNGDRIKLYNDLVNHSPRLSSDKDPTHIRRYICGRWGNIRTLGQSGFAVNAVAGVDMALWDLRAKLVDLNVANLIGACRTTMPVYNSGDYWNTLSLDDAQKNAAAHMAQGFRAFKLRLTGNNADDIARVNAIRAVIGDKNALLVDLNQRSTVPNAIRLGRALEEFNLTWFEEPLPYHDHAGEAEITAALDTPVASGESVYTSRGILEMLKTARLRHRNAGPAAHGRPDGISQSRALCGSFQHAGVKPLLYRNEHVAAGGDPACQLARIHAVAGANLQRADRAQQGDAVMPTAPGGDFVRPWR